SPSAFSIQRFCDTNLYHRVDTPHAILKDYLGRTAARCSNHAVNQADAMKHHHKTFLKPQLYLRDENANQNQSSRYADLQRVVRGIYLSELSPIKMHRLLKVSNIYCKSIVA